MEYLMAFVFKCNRLYNQLKLVSNIISVCMWHVSKLGAPIKYFEAFRNTYLRCQLLNGKLKFLNLKNLKCSVTLKDV